MPAKRIERPGRCGAATPQRLSFSLSSLPAGFLGTGAEAEVLTSGWAVQNYPTITFISLAGQSNETISLPDERDTVIKLILQAK